MASSEEEVVEIGELIQKGINGARADDTKGMKGAIIDWITPKGLDWTNIQTQTKLMNGEIQVPGDQWPVFLYADYSYDPEDPWNGLLRSGLLVSAYKHIFTSPSSVDHEPKATRSRNAHIHGMRCMTKASIAYVATQARFGLTSAQIFSHTDLITDSE
ncbi:hypothetical protein PISMIDRAFT_17923 [Pisolithus microcarpus 441]|uniref:Uncharacterized protein n=1 Tax=Pisolithus microcarpus 441 TaxID=765257 RepID=A0A0C9Z0M4_9AGAM|nr:hypothetical protein PISMIDRAFT_17923 [Pisolithus microcarpus 441]